MGLPEARKFPLVNIFNVFIEILRNQNLNGKVSVEFDLPKAVSKAKEDGVIIVGVLLRLKKISNLQNIQEYYV